MGEQDLEPGLLFLRLVIFLLISHLRRTIGLPSEIYIISDLKSFMVKKLLFENENTMGRIHRLGCYQLFQF